MKHISHILLLLAALLVTACTSDDTDFSDIINDVVEPVVVAVDSTALAEQRDVVVTDPTDEAYNDYVENSTFNRILLIRYAGEQATVSGTVSGVTVSTNGAHVTVTSTVGRLNLRLTGASSNGSLKVYSENKYRLSLEGVTLTNPNGAAINNQCGKTLYVVLADGSYNTFADGTTYADVDDEDCKGAFFSEGQVVFSGYGSLKVEARGRHGIASDDYLRFRPGGRYYVHATSGHGMKANDGITIDGSVINVEVDGDSYKGLNSDSHVTVSGGRTTLITRGDCTITTTAGVADTTSCAALKCDAAFAMSGGTLRMLSTGDAGKGLNAGTTINVTGGDLVAVAMGTRKLGTPKAVKSTLGTTIAGGKFYAFSYRNAPLDVGGKLVVAPGYTTYDTSHRQLVLVVF